MRRTAPIVAVVLAASLGIWLAGRGVAPSADAVTLRPQRQDAPAAPGEATLAEPTEPTPPPRAAPAAEPRAPSVATTIRWIEGRVVFPEGTPADERVLVTSHGRERRAPPFQEVEVGADGRFRIGFVEPETVHRLRIVARYLFLDGGGHPPPWEAKLGPSDLDSQVVLRPRLGGRIEGRIVAEDGVALPDDLAVVGRTNGPLQLNVEVAADGTFAIDALPPDYGYELSVRTHAKVHASSAATYVHPGEVTEVELVLSTGASVSGIVVDEAGRPIEGARMSVRGEDRSRPGSSGVTNASGAFEIRGVAPGAARLEASHLDYLTKETDLGVLREDDVRTGITLVLERGRRLAGRVVFPDGTPAARAGVQVVGGSFTQSDDQGRFELLGLGDGALAIEAYKKQDGQRWIARLEGVLPDTRVITLDLAPAPTITGRVVDQRGEPVERFVVVAYLRDASFDSATPGERVAKRFRDEQGAFELDAPPGVYLVHAEADGYAFSEPASIEVPQREEDLVLVVPDPFVVSGAVSDPDGKPVHGARVEGRYATDGEGDLSSRTDTSGAFEIRADRRDLVLLARRKGFTDSAPVSIEAPGQGGVHGVSLVLRASGTLTGELHPSLGSVAGWNVRAYDGSSSWSTKSDAKGRFELGDLPPGRLQVTASEAPSRHGWSTRYAEVTIEAGRTTHVVLGEPSENGVRVHGRVLDGGEVVPSASLWVRASGTNAWTEDVTVGPDGEYEVRVPHPGMYEFGLARERESFRFEASVPGVTDHELDVVLPRGHLRGRVAAYDGSVVSGARVSVKGASGTRTVKTDENGRFEVTHVSTGPLVLQAESNRDDCAPAVRADVILEEADRAEVDLVLPRAGLLRGRVTRGGIPAASYVGAWLGDVRVENATVRADEDGHFFMAKLPPGELTLRIHGIERSFPVTVVAGETTVVELDLAD